MLVKKQSSNTSTAKVRLMKDLARIEKEGDDGILASPSENNLFNWDAMVFGPENTPWEGGMFKLQLVFTEEYPIKPPKIRFLSKVFHPNGNSFNFSIYIYINAFVISLR